MNTLLLDLTFWDLILDSSGNIAMAAPPYALAQDVASAIKTFEGEVWYDDTLGIPYFAEILGETPPLSVFEGYMSTAGEAVPGVVSAATVLEVFSTQTRKVGGQVQFVDNEGNTGAISV